MDYRQVTPPANYENHQFDISFQCPGGSASTNNTTFWPNDWSPESVMTAGTHLTTPSPEISVKPREVGPALLPRVRPQDQAVSTGHAPSQHGHSRTASLPANVYPMQFGSYLPKPAVERRSASPAGRNALLTPVSINSTYDHMMMDNASRRPSIATVRSVSANNVRTHSRNSSSTSIDASVLGRYGFPTYRQSPTPQPMPGCGAPMSRTPSAMSHLAPIMMPNGQVQSYPTRRRTASPPAQSSRLSLEVEFDPQLDFEESTILDYLTAPNPTPCLVQRTAEPPRPQCPYMWYDVRNVVPWTDFNISTVSSLPSVLNLLNVKVAARRNLPTPGRVNLNPETPAQLAEACAKHHAVKVNAALKLALGDKHMAVRALQPNTGSRQQPEFVSNYQSDVERTIFGDGRGRVIGIVKCYEKWNSGMRNGTAEDKVHYLRGLAHLHHFLREHGCRYGFIMTEIEVVCVRAGGVPTEDSAVPLFGYLEVAEPVRMSDFGMNENGNLRMTAGLALWYLHMLAKEQPFPGQLHWKMDVGGPAALSRQHHLERDDWMPKPNLKEKRDVRRVRGWVFPDEPLHKKEIGRGRKIKI